MFWSKSSKQALPGRLRTPVAQMALPLFEGRRSILPKPRSCWRLGRDPAGLVQMDSFCGELRYGLLKSNRPPLCARVEDRAGRNPRTAQGPDRGEHLQPGAQPSLRPNFQKT